MTLVKLYDLSEPRAIQIVFPPLRAILRNHSLHEKMGEGTNKR